MSTDDDFLAHGEFYREWHIFTKTEGSAKDGLIAFKLGGDGLFATGDTLQGVKEAIDRAEDDLPPTRRISHD